MRVLPPSSKNRIGPFMAMFDFFWLAVSPFIALWLRDPSFLDPIGLPFHIPVTYQYSFITIFSSLPIFPIFRLNDRVGHLFAWQDARLLLLGVFLCVLSSVFCVFFFSRLEGIPRSVPIIFGLVLVFGLINYRLFIRRFYENTSMPTLSVSSKLEAIYDKRRIIIVGLDSFVVSAIHLFDCQNPRTIIVVAVISPNSKYAGRVISGIKIIGGLTDIGATIDEYNIHGVAINEVWVSDNLDQIDEKLFFLVNEICLSKGIECKRLYRALNLTPVIIQDESTFINDLNISIPSIYYLRLKRIFDIVFSILLVVFLLPIIIIMILGNFLFFGLPIFFWQERPGRYGNIFRIYKFRTVNLTDHSGNFPLLNDDGLSKYAQIVRRLRLDEIPQLLNIIAGEMSIVGPRPLLSIDQPINKTIRLLLRPGITGWAQVHGGNKLTIEEKNALDCWYVCNASLKLDFLITAKTIFIVCFGVKRDEEVIKKAEIWMRTAKFYDCLDSTSKRDRFD